MADAPPPDWLLPGPIPPAAPTDERCAIAEIVNDAACPEASLARATVAPGVTTQLHALVGVREVYVILDGSGVMEIDGRRARVEPGDRVVIPPGAAQRIANDGSGPLVFDCLCAPRFTPETYIALGP